MIESLNLSPVSERFLSEQLDGEIPPISKLGIIEKDPSPEVREAVRKGIRVILSDIHRESHGSDMRHQSSLMTWGGKINPWIWISQRSTPPRNQNVRCASVMPVFRIY